MFLPIKR